MIILFISFPVSFDLKQPNGDGNILSLHVSSWMNQWMEARIEISDNLLVSKVINGAMYYLLSSLPITTPTLNPIGQFYGLSPGSLAFGSHDFDKVDIIQRPMDYQGMNLMLKLFLHRASILQRVSSLSNYKINHQLCRGLECENII